MTGTDEQTLAVGDAIFVGLYEFYRRSLMLGRAPTGQYPDGLAYDPRRNAIWTTNESARSAGFGRSKKVSLRIPGLNCSGGLCVYIAEGLGLHRATR